MDELTKVDQYLDINEASSLLHLKKSYIYRLVSERRLPFYKPSGGRILFDRQELEGIVKTSRVSTNKELNARADDILNARVTRRPRSGG